MNGSPKELTAFLVALAANYAVVKGIHPPLVVEVPDDGKPRHAGEVHPTVTAAVKAALAGAGDVSVNGAVVKASPEPEKPEPVAGGAVDPEADAKAEAERIRALGIPNPDDAKPEPKADEPKARKSRGKKGDGESRLSPGVTQAQYDAAKAEAECEEAAQKAGLDVAQPKPSLDYVLPDGWDTWSVGKRRVWVESSTLAPVTKFKLLQDNPVPEKDKVEPKAEPKPETKPETKSEPVTDTAKPEAEVGTCELPPTWGAWSLAKRIMWATMRSVAETNALLVQFGFGLKIAPATAENLSQVRRKLEIAMRMEAQA